MCYTITQFELYRLRGMLWLIPIELDRTRYPRIHRVDSNFCCLVRSASDFLARVHGGGSLDSVFQLQLGFAVRVACTWYPKSIVIKH